MIAKRLTVAGILAVCIISFLSAVSFADELSEVQKKIKEKGLKWVAEQVPNPEKRGLGLLKDGFTAAVTPPVTEGQVQAAILPATLDWRNVGLDNLLGVPAGNYVTPVKSQGNCGSCWAFATTATAESTTHISLNDPIIILDPNSDYDLSEQDMLNCSGAGSCNGGYVSFASSYLSTTGLLQEKPAGCYAYYYPSSLCPDPTSFPTCDQGRYKIDNWSGVSATVDAMKTALNTYGPLVVTYAVYSDFYNYYASGIYEAVSCDNSVNKLVGYHAVSLVGYQDPVGTTPGYFVVKNSWGTGWGEPGLWWNEKGYFRIGYSQLSNCVEFGGTTLAYSKISCSGSITVTSPTNSDTWQAGTSHVITWTSSGSIGQYVKIDLYQGTTFVKTISSSTPLVNGSYAWLIGSNLAGSNYAITVTSTACGSAAGSSSYFTISAAQGFNASGSVTSVSGTGFSGVTMTFSRVSGTGSLPVAALTDSGGNWSQTGFQQGTYYRVTPSKANTSFSPASRDFSGSDTGLNFTAVENKITAVLSPTGGSWTRGTILPIKWTHTGNPGSFVKIELISSANVKTTITSRTKIGSGGTGSLNWKIPNRQAAGSYTIRVTSTTNGSSATSASFTIN